MFHCKPLISLSGKILVFKLWAKMLLTNLMLLANLIARLNNNIWKTMGEIKGEILGMARHAESTQNNKFAIS